MSMNRLRNVAVRIRPLANTVGPLSDTDPDPNMRPGVPAPRRVVHEPAKVPSKRQIWDLEDTPDEDGQDQGGQDEGVPSRDRSLALPERPGHPPYQDKVPTPPPGLATPSGGGRSKTRILGFHAQDLEDNLFERLDSTPRGPQFPAGFLVVVDGPGRGAFFAVSTSVSTIGRSAHQDVALDFGDESISREGHASVVYDEEQNRFFLGHGNKANVVRRNGTPVLATEELTHGDLVRIGKTTLRFHAFCGDDFTWGDPTSTSRDPGHND